MVKVSDAAIAELRRWSRAQDSGSPEQGWTVTLRKVTGSCHPWAYDLQLSPGLDKDEPGAIALENGLQLVVADVDHTWSESLTVDYAEDLIGGGFQFNNPQITQVCSCGVCFDLS